MGRTLKEAWDKQWEKRKLKMANCTHPGVKMNHYGGQNGVVAVYKCPSCKAVETEVIL